MNTSKRENVVAKMRKGGKKPIWRKQENLQMRKMQKRKAFKKR